MNDVNVLLACIAFLGVTLLCLHWKKGDLRKIKMVRWWWYLKIKRGFDDVVFSSITSEVAPDTGTIHLTYERGNWPGKTCEMYIKKRGKKEALS